MITCATGVSPARLPRFCYRGAERAAQAGQLLALLRRERAKGICLVARHGTPRGTRNASLRYQIPRQSTHSYVRLQGFWAKQFSSGPCRSVRGDDIQLHGMGDGALRRRSIKLLSAGWLPHSVFRPGLALSRVGHEAQPCHVVELGRSPPRPRPDPVQSVRWPIRDSELRLARPRAQSPTGRRPSRGRSPPPRPARASQRP